MTDRVLVDTGPLVAICLTKDQQHARCVAQLHRLRPPLLTCWPVLAEAAYLLRRDRAGFSQLLNSFNGGFLQLLSLEEAEIGNLETIVQKYGNLEPQLADAALVYLSSRERIRTVFTLDRRDFSVYRAAGNKPFSIVP